MGMGTARNTLPRPDWQLAGLTSPLAVAGAAVCIGLTVALASGRLLGPGIAAVAGAAFVLLIIWCLAEPRTDRTLAVFALYIGLLDAYLKLSTGIAEFAILRDVLLWAIAAGALWRAADRKENLSLPPLSGLVIAFALVVLAELFNPASPGLLQGLAGVRQHIEFIPLFFLAYAVLRTERQLKGLLLIFVVCASASGVASYVQSSLTPAEFASWGPGYSDQILATGLYQGAGRTALDSAGQAAVRPFGLGSDFGAGALAAVAGIPALLALLILGSTRMRIGLTLLAPGIILGVATSGGRGAIVAALTSLATFLLLSAVSRRAIATTWLVTVMVAGGFVVYTALAPNLGTSERNKSLSPAQLANSYGDERLDSLRLAPLYAARFPLGAGVGQTGAAAFNAVLGDKRQSLNAETEWNYLIVETGVLGLLIYLVLIGRVLARAAFGLRKVADERIRLPLAAVAATLPPMLVLGFGSPTSPTLLWLAAGIFSFWMFGPASTTAVKSEMRNER